VKKYPFPPGVASMSPADYRDHCARMSAAERAAVSARKKERDAMAARRRETLANGPRARIAALAIGESVTLAGYTKTTQTSSAIRSAYIATGGRYSSRLARDLVTGESVIGVTVTRDS
jgi:hypothetical protein